MAKKHGRLSHSRHRGYSHCNYRVLQLAQSIYDISEAASYMSTQRPRIRHQSSKNLPNPHPALCIKGWKKPKSISSKQSLPPRAQSDNVERFSCCICWVRTPESQPVPSPCPFDSRPRICKGNIIMYNAILTFPFSLVTPPRCPPLRHRAFYTRRSCIVARKKERQIGLGR